MPLALLTGSPNAVAGQDTSREGMREIVSKEVTVGRDEAALAIEVADGTRIEIDFEDGRVRIDGEEVGSYAESETFSSAWRRLLGEAVALEDGPLARALLEWSPPEGLESDALRTAELVDRALERVLRDDRPGDAPAPLAPPSPSANRLLEHPERLGALAAALTDLDVDDVQIRIGEDVRIEEEVDLDATLVVVDGNLEIEGEVRGHVIVVDGTLRTGRGSRITGDVRLVDAEFLGGGGSIEGGLRRIGGDEIVLRSEAEARARSAERAAEAAARAYAEVRSPGETDDGGVLAPVRAVGRNVARSVGGVFRHFVNFLVLGTVGCLFVLFGRDNLEVVASTARRSPVRAATVGTAGAFLTLPVWILGAVALTVSIIGIPVLLAWIPLFPIAVILAAGLGYFAVAHNFGDWLARRRYPYLNWVRSSNPYTLVVGGVLGFLAAFFLASIVMAFGSWLSFLRGMFVTLGIAVTVVATVIGFGAVILTRAGRRPDYYHAGGDLFDDAWDWEAGTGESRSP